MNKLNVAVVGYGNLGKAVEKELSALSNINLVGVFSKRNVLSEIGSPIYHADELENFSQKIDLLVLCSGSATDMMSDATKYVSHFDIINTFDTHEKIFEHYCSVNKVACASGHTAIVCSGWDPGLMSTIRANFFATLNKQPTTFWGKGISLGHSQAARSVDGVLDAISITIPSKKAQKNAKYDKNYAKNSHKRHVFVVLKLGANKNQVAQSIKSIPNYFAGQCVKVTFVSKRKLTKIKNFCHAGRIVCGNKNNELLEFFCKMKSNPKFTAKIILSYVRVFDYLKRKYGAGAFLPLHFSALDLLDMSTESAIKNFC
ncbi:MAG: diaminopimelate dehydrogenase [Clostridia bacterium]|nr:diaminopimelate dehydrogenase [Clostridia bacterium]